jgi:hypothetical protein
MSEPAAAPATAPAAPAPVSTIEAIYGPSKPQAAAPVAPEPSAPAASVVEPEPEPVDPAAPAAEPGAEVAEEVELSSLTELADHFELDPEWLKTLKVSDKVNGAQVEFSIAEALATHRKVQAADAHLADAKARSKALLDEATQQKESWAAGIATVNELVQTLESEITRDAGGLTQALKESDPAMYAVRQNEIRERRERLAAIKQKAQQGIHQAVQKSQAEQVAAMNQRLPQERETLLALVPEWSDEAKASAEQKAVATYLTEGGFSPDDIRILAHNGRALAMAVKAMRYDSAKTKSEAIRKKVVKIPKVLKPGPKPAAAPKPNGAANDPVSILYGSNA